MAERRRQWEACLLGLLFLLLKERRTSGSVQVSVQGPGFAYSSLIPAYNETANLPSH